METKGAPARKKLPKLVVGLTGVAASGKSTVAGMFRDFGFQHTSINEALKREVEAMSLRVTRENMKFVGERLFAKHGCGILAVYARSWIVEKGGAFWTIEGIANPHEVAELNKLPSFILVGVECGFEQVFMRMAIMRRRSDMASRGRIEKHFYEQLGEEGVKGYWQIGRCLELAEYTIDNHRQYDPDVDLKTTDLFRQVERFVAQRGVMTPPWAREGSE
ncbi:MAG: dephospho-CoA kinase [bacterium]